MQKPTHQTIKLSTGKHLSPTTGACVMELASMLAGEPFSDHPRSVSRPVAAFLRGYNDMLDDRRRQDLYECAATVISTAASPDIEDARARRLVEWANERRRRRTRIRWLASFRSRRHFDCGEAAWDSAARYALQSIGRISDHTHTDVLDLVDELVGIDAATQLAERVSQRDMRPDSPTSSQLDGVGTAR